MVFRNIPDRGFRLKKKSLEKFKDPEVTLDGATRASVTLSTLKTLWFNTGTRCNLSCPSCYIESSPVNDRLAYLDINDVLPYLDEIKNLSLPTTQIAFTGGEPFINPHFISIIEEVLMAGFETLILTNAYRVMNPYKKILLQLKERFGRNLFLRVSLDHYTPRLHEQERGQGSFKGTMENLTWLYKEGFRIAVAGRSFSNETESELREGHHKLFLAHGINLSEDELIIFPEMDENADVPEITTRCWDILGKKPDDMMCATSRMIVKRRGATKTTVLPCTLLPYDEQFELGPTLAQSKKTVSLNHPHCSRFCVLGGASCS